MTSFPGWRTAFAVVVVVESDCLIGVVVVVPVVVVVVYQNHGNNIRSRWCRVMVVVSDGGNDEVSSVALTENDRSNPQARRVMVSFSKHITIHSIKAS